MTWRPSNLAPALLFACSLPVALGCSSGSSPIVPADASTETDGGPNGNSSEGGARPPRSTVAPTVVREPVLASVGGVIWDLAFLPDGAALFTVRSGQVRKLAPGASSSTVVADLASAGAPLSGLFAEGQSGLMGLAIDPAFAQNRRVYVYMSHDAAGTKDNRVVRYRLTDQDTLADRADIVTGISYKVAATANGGPGAHSGGRLRFGPDGLLYLTTGDTHNATIPQDVEALGAKVLRFTTDGAAAPANPALGSRNLIWARGFRNPQGLAFHPFTGNVFISEHGPGTDDEITKLTAGANGGWNPNAGGVYNGYTGALMTDTTAVPTAVPPIWKQENSDGMSACTFLRGTRWQAWENRLAVAFLNGSKIELLDFDDALTAVVDMQTFPNVAERVRSVVLGPDERLYVTSDSGEIFRLSPQ